MTKTVLTVIDYGAGNVKSVCNALTRIGFEYEVTGKSEKVEKATKIIMPGVGSAESAMEELRKRDLVGVIQNTRAPFLGICLGMQVLFEWSEEGNTECLGIIKGRVKRFNSKLVMVPQMGWNRIETQNSKLKVQNYNLKLKTTKTKDIFDNIPDGSYFYFVHSYYCKPTDKKIITATAEYGIEFASAVQYKNFYGVQFHPEKSGEVGLQVLKNFCKIKI